jgi:hypothetical protein
MPYDYRIERDAQQEQMWRELAEVMGKPGSSPLLSEPQPEPEPERPMPLEHGEVVTTDSGRVLRWVMNVPDHPKGAFIPPEWEWESGEYKDYVRL